MISKEEYEYIKNIGQNVIYITTPLDENCPKTKYFIVRKDSKDDFKILATQKRRQETLYF